MCGAWALRRPHSHGSSLIVAGSPLKWGFITQLPFARRVALLVWWCALVVEQLTRAAFSILGASGGTEMEGGTGSKLPIRPNQKLQFQDTSIQLFSWVPSWWLLVVEPTQLVSQFHWKSMILSHLNGINSTLFRDLDIHAGLQTSMSMFTEDSNMKLQISRWKIFVRSILWNYLLSMKIFYKRSNLKKRVKTKIKIRKSRATSKDSTIWIGSSS